MPYMKHDFPSLVASRLAARSSLTRIHILLLSRLLFPPTALLPLHAKRTQYTYHDCVSGSVSAGSAVHTLPSASTV